VDRRRPEKYPEAEDTGDKNLKPNKRLS